MNWKAIALATAVISGASVAASPVTEPSAKADPVIYPAQAEPAHRPILHNERIHVYEVRLKPGERTFYHRHTHDQLGIVLGTSTTGNQVLGSPETTATSAMTISYVPHSIWGGTVHRVRAIEGPFHVIGIEFAKPAPAGSKVLVASPDQMELVVPQGRISRLTIAPGEVRPLTGALLVAAGPGRLKLADNSAWSFTEGSIRWIGDAGEQRFTNDGKAPVSLLLLKLND